MEILMLTKRYVMENPAGGLEKMWYMMDWEESDRDVCVPVAV